MPKYKIRVCFTREVEADCEENVPAVMEADMAQENVSVSLLVYENMTVKKLPGNCKECGLHLTSPKATYCKAHKRSTECRDCGKPLQKGNWCIEHRNSYWKSRTREKTQKENDN